MKNKNGFTLTELLAVIALISILSLMAVPAIISQYNNAVQKEMKVQENEVKSAANIYLTDYCLEAIDDASCPETMVKQNYICLSDLQKSDTKYINKVLYKKYPCDGVIVYDENETYEDGKTYLFCGYEDEKFAYATDMNYYTSKYSSCFVNNPKPKDSGTDIPTEPVTPVDPDPTEPVTPVDPTEPVTPTDPETPTKKVITVTDSDPDAYCTSGIEYYYQNYYFTCHMSSRIIVTVNGTKYTIKEALNNKIVTMDELRAVGFTPLEDKKNEYATE